MENSSLKKEIENLEIRLQRLRDKTRKGIIFLGIMCIGTVLMSIGAIIYPPTPLTPKWMMIVAVISLVFCIATSIFFAFRCTFAAFESMGVQDRITNLKKISIIKADESITIKELFDTIKKLP